MSNEKDNNKFYKDLSDKLGIGHELSSIESENLPDKIDDTSKSLALAVSEEEMRLFETDFHTSRQTLQDLSFKYQDIIEHYTELTKASESARHYEVLIKMMDSAGKMANDLIELHNKKENYKGNKKSDADKAKDGSSSMNIKNANIVVGTTADMMKKINNEDK